MSLLRPALLLVAVWLTSSVVGAAVLPQDFTPPTSAGIREQLDLLERTPPDNAEELKLQLNEALASLTRIAELEQRGAGFQKEAAEAPNAIQALQEPSQTSELLASSKLPASSSLQDLEGQLLKLKTHLSSLRSTLAELESTSILWAKRKSELPEELSQAKQRLEEIKNSLLALPGGNEQAPQRTLLLAQYNEQAARIQTFQTNLGTYEVRKDVLTRRTDRTRQEIATLEGAVAALQQRVDEQRTAEGNSSAVRSETRLEAITRRFPLLQDLADETRVQVQKRSGEQGLPRRISQAQAASEATRLKWENLRSRHQATRRRILVGELGEGMGQLLRFDYESLPTPSELRALQAQIEGLLTQAQLEQIDTEEARRQLAERDLSAESYLRSLTPEVTGELRDAHEAIRKILSDAHDAVRGDLETLTTELYAQKEVTRSLIAEAGAYREFIEDRILWVRSSPANPLQSLRDLPDHLSRLQARLGQQFGSIPLAEGTLENRGVPLLMGLLAIVLLLARGGLRRRQERYGDLVRSYKTDAYGFTLRSLALTVLSALPLPLLLWGVGSLLITSAVPSADLPVAAGQALRELAAVSLVLRFLRGLAIEKGLATAHFKWNQEALSDLKRELRWFEPVALMLGFFVLALDRQEEHGWGDSMGRIAFIVLMGLSALFVVRMLRRDGPLWFEAATGSVPGRLRTMLILAASLVPALLGFLAITGYYYTAIQFELRLRYSMGFALGLLLVYALLIRWLFITRRRLAVKQALEAKERREKEEQALEGASTTAAVLDAEKVDIPAIDAQTRQLFKTSVSLATMVGLFMIWASALPALRGLSRVQLLPELTVLSAQESDLEARSAPPGTSRSRTLATPLTPAGALTAPAEEPVEEESPEEAPYTLTLEDVLLATLFLLLTTVAAKNLPALLELSLLQRMPLGSGSRYAISTLVRYLIVIIGLSAISGALGIGWHNVQWLAAALTFGLAFGLQEIFANFVSGLIILIERPIRVGDIVTVGSTEGRVTQLRMRATTIVDWDRREYLVPNKEFITGSIINWTLSDPITRVTIPVGIAYGSDTELARKLLLQAARSNPLILKDPEPSAVFRSFGNSTLDLELRVFIANRDLWPHMIDKIHTQIDQEFRKAKVEIAFPQCDLHIRSAPGLREERPATGADPQGSSAARED